MTIKNLAIGNLLLKVEHIRGTQALPDIYTLARRPVALGQVHIYQAKHSHPWYNYYIYSQ